MPAPPGPTERGALAAAGLAPLAAAPSRRPASKFVRLLGAGARARLPGSRGWRAGGAPGHPENGQPSASGAPRVFQPLDRSRAPAYKDAPAKRMMSTPGRAGLAPGSGVGHSGKKKDRG